MEWRLTSQERSATFGAFLRKEESHKAWIFGEYIRKRCWARGWSKRCKDIGPPRDVDVAEVEAAIEEKKLPPDFKDEVCILAGRIILEHERFKDLWKSPVSAENEAQLINCIEDS